jgi:hypothetical protein
MMQLLAAAAAAADAENKGIPTGMVVLAVIVGLLGLALLNHILSNPPAKPAPPTFVALGAGGNALANPPRGSPSGAAPPVNVELEIDQMEIVVVAPPDRELRQGRQ